MRTNRLLTLMLLGCTVLLLTQCTNDQAGPLSPQSGNNKSVSVSLISVCPKTSLIVISTERRACGGCKH
jgi:hypothetical protein